MTEIHTFINCKKNKSNNLRPETYHITVRVNHKNNYAAVCKEGCELTSLSNAVMSRDKEQTNQTRRLVR